MTSRGFRLSWMCLVLFCCKPCLAAEKPVLLLCGLSSDLFRPAPRQVVLSIAPVQSFPRSPRSWESAEPW